ncbi:leucyl/phenylalanyl-tRNA--protein transferase [beta proteobacterium KB13]|uniref:Leucyl/phenylalanyl-tRNA--protein transferase n=1 Tax=beta proteobacterium KB13 TaxID=314607 RepID=B6BUD6_9PROT|nr:leucyl/phenylalanyl-tRNA--protein transferase [beta proteobacterium KB13]
MENKILLIKEPSDFNNINFANISEDGLVGISAELNIELILSSYKLGIFPWFNENEPILWWSPNPRQVLFIDKYKPSKSLLKEIKKNKFIFEINKNFSAVIHACKKVQRKQSGTWIDARIIDNYTRLHQIGHAHSFEIYNMEYSLVGGIYGILSKNVFFGESMFHLENNASKVCFYFLCKWLKEQEVKIIDAQVESEHISQWGGELISRDKFMDIILS